jgi:hypothetical protein
LRLLLHQRNLANKCPYIFHNSRWL